MSINRGLIIPSGKIYSPTYDADGLDAYERVTARYSRFSAAATTVNWDIPVVGGVQFEDAFAVLRQNFTGGAVASARLSVGNPTDPALLLPSMNIFSGAPASLTGLAITGLATLVAGTVTVSTRAIRTGAQIMLTRNTPGGAVGDLSAPAASIVDQTSFVINSANAGDTSTVNWFIAPPQSFKGSQLFTSTTFLGTNPWNAGTLRIQLIVTGANANALTSGNIDLFFMVRLTSVRT